MKSLPVDPLYLAMRTRMGDEHDDHIQALAKTFITLIKEPQN